MNNKWIVAYLVQAIVLLGLMLALNRECQACEVVTIVKDGKHVVCSICPGVIICN